MLILPVIDLLRGQVVRGVAGRRSEYRPIVSRLTASALPLDVAEAFRKQFGLSELYLADLDAIGGLAPAWPTYAELQVRGFCLWVDAGIQEAERARQLAEAGVARIVVGLETIRGPDELTSICQLIGPARVAFSLDLKGGQPLGAVSAWAAPDAWTIACQALAAGVERLIVLDLERVGVGSGTGTEELCRRLARANPAVTIIAGGGVRNRADIDRLEQCGLRAVLMASALHDGGMAPSAPSGRG